MKSEAYENYKKMLLQLQSLHAAGKDQTPEADAIRDAMEMPERLLSPFEQERLNGLSADLFMLTGDEIKVSRDDLATEQNFHACWHAKEWDKILAMLRKENFRVREDQVAALRAACWEELGDYDVATLFSEYALKLGPGNLIYHKMLAHELSHLPAAATAGDAPNMFEKVLRERTNEIVLQSA